VVVLIGLSSSSHPDRDLQYARVKREVRRIEENIHSRDGRAQLLSAYQMNRPAYGV